MPGVRFAQSVAGLTGVPNLVAALMAGGSAGGVTMNGGDLVVKTIKSTLTANAPGTSTPVPVLRTLLAADVTATYQQGGSICGIFGAIEEDVTTNGSGQATSPPAFGGIATGGQVQYPYGQAGLNQVDPLTARGQVRVLQATGANVYGIKLSAASAIGTPALIGKSVALLLTTLSNGQTLFQVDTTNATTAVLEIVGINTSDPNYGAAGCEVFCVVLPTYRQGDLGVYYSSN
jgi:hypothetical protein